MASVGAFASWLGVGATRVSRLLDRAGSTTTIADIQGGNVNAELETTRVYTRPTAEDRSKAIDLLPVDD